MKLIQYIGPFSSGDILEVPAQTGYAYVHIGLQIPKRNPVKLITDRALSSDLTINGVSYRVGDSCILEFDETDIISLNIRIDRDLPWESIIDIIFEAQGD